MKIGILTSSRADFGIYQPLLNKLWEDNYFNCEIIAFGTHLEKNYGLTINDIIKSGFQVKHQIKTTPKGDSPANISESIGKTIVKFSGFWETNDFDLIIALGDRYEMFAAVASASAFNLNIAHIHAGETTIGAIDNSYRHSISLMSNYLFVTTEEYKARSIEITQNQTNVFNVGALSIDNLTQTKLFSISDFYHKFKIDLNIPTILSTFHPETVSYKKNEIYIRELIASFRKLTKDYQIIITMPNADTMGIMIRSKLEEYAKTEPNVILIESFGMIGYLSCMKHCKFLLGNTSSGFVEAAYFPKWVINLGNRQEGRILTPNIVNCNINESKILQVIGEISNKDIKGDTNIYGNGNAAEKIIDQLKFIKL
jgi:GDP/UDP-N,N'-diacetylbacillosamine 2-epimerase (hydrolysing)